MTGRLKSLQDASLQTADCLEGGCGLREVVGKGDPRAERKKKVVEQLLHKSQHPGAVKDLPSKSKRPGNLVSGVIFQVFCLLFKCCGRPLNPVESIHKDHYKVPPVPVALLASLRDNMGM